MMKMTTLLASALCGLSIVLSACEDGGSAKASNDEPGLRAMNAAEVASAPLHTQAFLWDQDLATHAFESMDPRAGGERLHRALASGLFNSNVTPDEREARLLDQPATTAADPGAARFRKTVEQIPDLAHWRDKDDQTLPFWIAQIDRVDFMQIAIDKMGPDALRARDRYDNLAHHFASSAAMAKFLDDRTWRIWGTPLWGDHNVYKKTPLMMLAARGSTEALGEITSHCNDEGEVIGWAKWAWHEARQNCGFINNEDAEKRTALMWAAIKGNAESVRALMRANANLNAEDAFGRTALHYAAMLKNFDAGAALLERRSDLGAANLQDLDRNLPLHLAFACKSQEAIGALKAVTTPVQNRNLKFPSDLANEPSACVSY